MIPRDIIKRIRTIQIRTSRQVDDMLAGNWHSAFKGRGIEFEEVRPYQVGDDVRSIDWNVTARYNQPFVKLFREERELSVRLLVDMSRSRTLERLFGQSVNLWPSSERPWRCLPSRIMTKVGLTLFTDRIERNIPPSQGSRHVLRLIRELLYCEPVGSGTDLCFALQHLNRTAKRRLVVFLISDFIAPKFESSLKIAARRHDLIPVRIEDPRESELPNMGLVRLRDGETGESVLVDTSSRRNREDYQRLVERRNEQLAMLFRRTKLMPLVLKTDEELIDPLRTYFRQRERR